jgi:hypothetical protein
MATQALNFIAAVETIEVDGEPVDTVTLMDGRVLVIDGETVTLFDDLDALLDREEDDEEVLRPAIPL